MEMERRNGCLLLLFCKNKKKKKRKRRREMEQEEKRGREGVYILAWFCWEGTINCGVVCSSRFLSALCRVDKTQ